ncbi:MAG: hypothetical protein HYV04_08070 [Deltaproteobacteria bacterium]|nr:hypothetical protein [Deltaproteobacteria bacterium]
MAERKRYVEDVGRPARSVARSGLPALFEGLAATETDTALREFLLRLNAALFRGSWRDRAERTGQVKHALLELLTTHQQAMVTTVYDFLEEMRLHYSDPLIEVIFETASEAPPLLGLAGRVVERENQMLRFRVRALEVSFMRSAQDQSPRWVGSEAEVVLRFLNPIVHSLEQRSIRGIKDLYRGFADNFQSIHRLIATADAGGAALSSAKGYAYILQLVQEALERLASAPTSPQAIRLVLDLLKVNAPLPEWHQSDGAVAGAGAEVKRQGKEDYRASLALILDKAVEIVFHLAGIGWAPDVRDRKPGEDLEDKLLSPANPRTLEASVVDAKCPVKIRRMAAALLRVLGAPLSPKVDFFADLFLMDYRSDALPDALDLSACLPIVDSDTKLPYLLEALEEQSDYVRWTASRVCARTARDHAQWFNPRHYARLLPLLADDHRSVRLSIVKTFQCLAVSREQSIAAVIRGITGDLTEDVYGAEDVQGTRRDLETALGITLGNLIERVDDLQSEVRDLEERRRQLLFYIEQQTMRIGEEIHHEILNTLCGYVATAVDEERHGEAKAWLQELVTELRRIMNNLYPRDLETEGFLATIRKRLEDAGAQARKRTPEFRVVFDCPEEITDHDIAGGLADPSHVVLLYRIVLESIINARRHAQGTSIRVTLRRSGTDLVEISISDNGCGDGGPFTQNVGIPLMLRRAQEIGAEIAFEKSSPSGGTTVKICLGRKIHS